MNDFVECVGIDDVIRKSGHDPGSNFEAIFSAIHREGKTDILAELDDRIRAYFSEIELPDDAPTVYDYLLLSLRPKDAIITFNWDPLLPQAYQRWRHLGAVLPELVFLHGNVDLGVDRDRSVFGFISDEPFPGRKLTPTKLLHPVDQKDYNTDPFIAEQWKKTTDFLAAAYYITVYGYSAPVTDVEARSLLLNAWKENTTRGLAQLSILDVRDPAEVEASWADFIADTHAGASTDFQHCILMRHPRRSCEAFAFATLQQDPWREDPFPACRSLLELENWIKPLIEEETSGQLSGKPLH